MAAEGRALTRATGATALERLIGLGSIFGKTLRDSRRAILIAAVGSGLLMLAGAAPLAFQFGTREARLELVASTEILPPVLTGLLGEPIAIDTMGGFLSWRIGGTLMFLLGIWSVVALSGTLAGESRRGSLDLLVSTPIARWRVAAQKYLGHAVAVAVAMLLAAALTTLEAAAFATLPGDDVPFGAALAHFGLTGLTMLAAGSVAFATGPVLGRARAAGLGFVALFGGYLVNSYASLSPLIDALRPLTWFSWTVDHRPLAGSWDWGPVIALALVTVGLAVVGAALFARRDLGRTAELAWLRLPSLPAGIGGPFVRQLSDRTAVAIGWGIGLGIYGSMIAASADAFIEGLSQIRGLEQLVAAIYPDLDLREPSAVLQLAFFGFGTLLVGLAAATFLGSWASDETERRLDVVLSTPASRVRWALASGAGVLAAVVIVAAVGAIPIGLSIAAQGRDVVTPVLGMGLMALYGAAFAGVGLAVGGVLRASLAGGVAGGLVIGSFVLELLGQALDLPDWLVNLSLNHHQGLALAGSYDPVGIVAGLVLAVGGLLVGAWGWGRRDIGR